MKVIIQLEKIIIERGINRTLGVIDTNDRLGRKLRWLYLFNNELVGRSIVWNGSTYYPLIARSYTGQNLSATDWRLMDTYYLNGGMSPTGYTDKIYEYPMLSPNILYWNFLNTNYDIRLYNGHNQYKRLFIQYIIYLQEYHVDV